ncbi:B9 domain-containing protein [Chloropicon primus]|uniref:B9 domain-containing protein n=1 Tax=Chloropicon primus TaxID=1764295 RepID=A0A5B8MSE9_9CHLO|nr:B9 domain-containing protein [Chloropicon primus]UPR02881.1 B9 domain-containing protein [Chloropicon primus]|eukprot:QDZ23668.1 B9 domain-containing protein [Chloropicon primus]
MAEVHILGQIVGGSNFSNKNIFCKWGVQTGQNFELVEGITEGQTQIDHPFEDEMAVWAQPLDVHFACRGVTGWPKLHFQVWSQDVHSRNDICGYGFCHVPTSPGMFTVECPCWLPEGTDLQQLSSFFVGGAPRLKHEDVVYSPGDRFRLMTKSTGVIHVHFQLVLKNFEKYGVRFSNEDV